METTTAPFRLSDQEQRNLRSNSGELLALLDAMSNELEPTTARTLASIAWDRAMEIAEIANTAERLNEGGTK